MLDGGAMFGVVPKSLWNKVYPADENNMINLAMRGLLVETGDRKILFDNGIGDKQDEKFFGHYFLNGDDSLDKSFEKLGVRHEEITDVVMTHLHFDHCGGGVRYNEKGELVLTFPNATYWCSTLQWENAVNPNARERASYLKENLLPIQESGRLKFIDRHTWLVEGIELRLYHGHTTGQLVPFIQHKGNTVVYVADLIPSVANITLAWITAYDMQPLVALEEKKAFLEEAANNNYVLFFEHDIQHECCTVAQKGKGIRPELTFTLDEYKKKPELLIPAGK